MTKHNSKIHVPSTGIDSWKGLLADPDLHWKPKKSAHSLAVSWEHAIGYPNPVKVALVKAGIDSEMILAIPEYQVYLDSKKAPSQNDLFILSKDADGLIVMMIEGKVSESFDKTIGEWYNYTPSRKSRFEFLLSKLEIKLKIEDILDLRYQLFHRLVSAILVAEEFNAPKAIMIVQSFSPSNEWFDDYSKFVKTLYPNTNPTVNLIEHSFTQSSGTKLYTGWIKDNFKKV